MTSADRIQAAKRDLRRKYSENVDGLKALADKVAEGAFEAVTITGSGYEGADDSGQITFEPMEYIAALEDLISDLDPDSPQPANMRVESDFSQRNALD
jgi:hypothetical protein